MKGLEVFDIRDLQKYFNVLDFVGNATATSHRKSDKAIHGQRYYEKNMIYYLEVIKSDDEIFAIKIKPTSFSFPLP